jgi:DNA-directed RNA polymerase subunit RPC12/RpoP
MTEHNKVQPPTRQYFLITPHIVWARVENVYQWSLWNVVAMIAGESGECFISTPDLATAAMMSVGKVSEERKALIRLGLLDGEFRRDTGYPQPVWHLRIPDLWAANVEWRLANPSLLDRIEDKRRMQEGEGSPDEASKEGSPGEKGVSPGEKGTTPGEPKKNQKEEPEEEPAAQAAASGDQPLTYDDSLYETYQGTPIIDLFDDDLYYECPWCKEEMLPVPSTTSLKSGYACPECAHGITFYRDGHLAITGKTPKKEKTKSAILGNLLDGIDRRWAQMMYKPKSVPALTALWSTEPGQQSLEESLSWAYTTEIPRHQKVERAIVAAETKMAAMGRKGDRRDTKPKAAPAKPGNADVTSDFSVSF